MSRNLTEQEEKIIKKLRKLDRIWVDSVKLFADSGTLLLIDSETGEVLEDTMGNNILCDGGDPDHTYIDGTLFINKKK